MLSKEQVEKIKRQTAEHFGIVQDKRVDVNGNKKDVYKLVHFTCENPWTLWEYDTKQEAEHAMQLLTKFIIEAYEK